MQILLALAFIVVFSMPAKAQNNQIIVIGEDGSISTIDIDPQPTAKPVEKTPAPAAKPAKKPEAKKQVMKKEEPAKAKPAKAAAVPKEKPPVKKTAAPKKNKEAKASKQKSVQPKQAASTIPEPAPEHIPASRYRLGSAMTPEDAIRIAVDVAPPARTVSAYPVNFKGLHAYEVVFKTEDGDQFVYVDRETGKIVK